jgi:hypothetical protein
MNSGTSLVRRNATRRKVSKKDIFGPVQSSTNPSILTMNPFDLYLTREMLKLKLERRTPALIFDICCNERIIYNSCDGKWQLQWDLVTPSGERSSFYFVDARSLYIRYQHCFII